MFEFIDIATEHSMIMKQVFNTYKYGCPAMGPVLNKFMVSSTEPLSGTWIDLKHWQFDFEVYMSYNYAALYHYLDDHRNTDLIPHHEVRPILNYMLSQFRKTGVSDEILTQIEGSTHDIIICNQAEKKLTVYE